MKGYTSWDSKLGRAGTGQAGRKLGASWRKAAASCKLVARKLGLAGQSITTIYFHFPAETRFPHPDSKIGIPKQAGTGQLENLTNSQHLTFAQFSCII